MATNTSRLTPMMTEVTGIILSIAERLAGREFWDGERARMAARHSGQIFCGSPGGGSSRLQLMQVGMKIYYGDGSESVCHGL